MFSPISGFLSRDQVRDLDRRAMEDYGIPGVVLMENAGRGAAGILYSLGVRGPVVICCGKGNNGGDGLVLARHLNSLGVAVQVLLFARPEDLSADAAVYWQGVDRAGLPRRTILDPPGEESFLRMQFSTADWIVDALFGTGLTGHIRSPLDRVIEWINEVPAKVLALDIPSGLDADTGRPLGAAVRALHTVTFASLKKGFAFPEAAPWLGQLHLVPIGIPPAMLG